MSKHFLIFILLFSFSPIDAQSDSISVPKEFSEVLDLVTASLDSIKKEQQKQEEALGLLVQLKSYQDNPLKLVKVLGIIFLSIVIVAYLLWRFFLWLNPNWYIKLIQRLIERYEEVNVLKRNKRILILMPPEANNKEFIEDFFKEREFSNTSKLEITSYFKPEGTVDVIFANNENGGIPQSILEEYLKNHETACLFYFGKPGSWKFSGNPELDSRLNLANSRAQIYGNLISTLKFHDLIMPKIRL